MSWTYAEKWAWVTGISNQLNARTVELCAPHVRVDSMSEVEGSQLIRCHVFNLA